MSQDLAVGMRNVHKDTITRSKELASAALEGVGTPEDVQEALVSLQVALAMVIVWVCRPEALEKVLELAKMNIDKAARDLIEQKWAEE